MKLHSLQIKTLPGIVEPFSITTDADGVLVISGPNASGKSSLLRALAYLLSDPRPHDPHQLALAAELESEAGRWRVERNAAHIQWWLDGKVAEQPPALPPRETLRNYLLGVDTLLAQSDSDEEITDRFRRELSGGYDLDAIGRGFEISPRSDQNHSKSVQQAARELHQVERENRQRVQDSQRLPQLQARIDEARRAAGHASDYEEAMRLLELRDDYRAVRARLEPWPAMPSPEVADEEAALGKRLDSLQQQIRQAEGEKQRADRTLKETGLADPEALDCRPARKWLDALRTSENQFAQLEQQYARGRNRREQAATLLGTQDSGELFRPDAGKVAEIESCANALYGAEKYRQEMLARVEAMASPVSGEQSPRDRLTWFGLGGGLLGGLVLLLLGWPKSVPLALLGASVLLVGLMVIALPLFRSKPVPVDSGADGLLQQASEKCQEAGRALRDSVSAAGLNPDQQGASEIQILVKRLYEFEEARLEETACRGELEALRQRLAQQRGQLQDFLAQWQAAPASADSTSLEVALDQLENRRQRARDALVVARQAEDQLTRWRDESKELREKIRALYQKWELPDGDRHALLQRLKDRPAWDDLREQCRTLEADIRVAEKNLADMDSGLRTWIENNDRQAIVDARDKALALSAELEPLLREREAINAAMDQARKQHPLEQHRAHHQQLAEEHERRFGQRMLNETAHFMLEEVAREHRGAHQPATLREADQRLRLFTHGRFAMELDDAGGLCAVDLQQKARRRLGELSVGTRMQLLIALRVAWIGQCEQHTETLPLFLDEALTTTDPERFNAVAGALAEEAAASKRQVFYLTAQSEDLQRWQRVIGKPPVHIDLARIRALDHATPSALALPELQRLPVPEEENLAEWVRQVGVRPLRPELGSGAVPLFYLLRDELPLLHRLMDELRLNTVGELQGLLDTPLARRLLDEATRGLLHRRIAMLEAWLAAWQTGHGRPVNRGALEQADAVSDTQLDRVDALANEVDRDARRIIEGLRDRRVSRFQTSKIDDLEAWFIQNGYLDPHDSLDRDERYRRVLAVSGDTEADQVGKLTAWLEDAASATDDH